MPNVLRHIVSVKVRFEAYIGARLWVDVTAKDIDLAATWIEAYLVAGARTGAALPIEGRLR